MEKKNSSLSKTTNISLLNLLLQKDSKNQPGKSGKQQILDNAESILTNAKIRDLEGRFQEFNELPCLLSTCSLDGRRRPQRAMRIKLHEKNSKINFRSYHITWIAKYGPIPLDLDYSHRCHQPTCVEPSHGIWENNQDNHSRNACKRCSHLFLPDRKCVLLCTHNPSE
jgi:hypothetical protein